MTKVIKEIIIFLLVALVMMLIFAVALYEYIPSRKVVAEVVTYSAPETIQEQLADNIDEQDNEIVLTYEVTSSDLNNYETTNDYIPGKSNPFAAVSTTETGSETTGNNADSDSTAEGNSTGGSSTTNNDTTNTPTGNTGIK